MERRTAKFISTLIILSLGLALFPYLAEANQPETPIEFVEGEEPLSMNYGEYTTGSSIEDATDIDRFSFYGSAGDSIRVLVSDKSGGSFGPRLEIWDPNNDKIVDTWDYSDISVDETLTTTGTYVMAVSDYFQDYSGDYTLQLEKIPPVFDPPGICYDFPVSDKIDHNTDMDFFTFEAEEGAYIRVLVSDKSGGSFGPRLEIWDPNNDKIVDTWDYSDISVDETLTTTGTYVMAVSDYFQDYSGDYGVEIQCLLGNCPCSPHLSVDITLNQTTFATGEELIVTANFINGPDPDRVEVKLWLENPDGRLRRIGYKAIIFLEPNADITMEVFRRPFTGDEPSGDWNVGGRLLNLVSGRQLSADVQSFTFSP